MIGHDVWGKRKEMFSCPMELEHFEQGSSLRSTLFLLLTIKRPNFQIRHRHREILETKKKNLPKHLLPLLLRFKIPLITSLEELTSRAFGTLRRISGEASFRIAGAVDKNPLIPVAAAAVIRLDSVLLCPHLDSVREFAPQCASAEYSPLRRDHIHGSIVEFRQARTASISDEQALEPLIVRFSHGAANADVRRDACDDQVLDATEAQQEFKVGIRERRSARLVYHGFPEARLEFGNDLVAWFAAN